MPFERQGASAEAHLSGPPGPPFRPGLLFAAICVRARHGGHHRAGGKRGDPPEGLGENVTWYACSERRTHDGPRYVPSIHGIGYPVRDVARSVPSTRRTVASRSTTSSAGVCLSLPGQMPQLLRRSSRPNASLRPMQPADCPIGSVFGPVMTNRRPSDSAHSSFRRPRSRLTADIR